MASNGELIAVWMDQSIGEEGAFLTLKQRFELVSPAISKWIYVDSDDKLLDCITERPHDKIVLITSGASAKRVLGSISHRENIYSVYIFCGRISKYEGEFRNGEHKLREIFDDENQLYERLQGDLNREFPS